MVTRTKNAVDTPHGCRKSQSLRCPHWRGLLDLNYSHGADGGMMRISECKAVRNGGFTLVELMIVTAIMAILASVAIPAYINYINRVRQSEAMNMLLTARLEMEQFQVDNNRFASTIGCLPSFGSDSCLNDCATCTEDEFVGAQQYHFQVASVAATNYSIISEKKIYSYAPTDVVLISSTITTPIVQNEAALHFSVFSWLFD